MRSPSLFSPTKQARYEKQSGPFQTFQTTNQVTQLVDFRKEVRNNISQREPFNVKEDKKAILLTSWKKHERKNTDGNLAKYMAKSSPKKSLPGGLNIEEIFQKKYIDRNQSANAYYQQQRKVDQLFKKDLNDSFTKDNSITNLFKAKRPSQNYISRQSGRDPSPIKGQYNLERYRSWDTKLDLQLKQLNNSKDLSFYKYSQQPIPIKEPVYEISKPIQTKDIFNVNKFNKFIRNSSPPKFIEKIPLTEIVKMQSYFAQLPTAEITQIPRGYLQELQNLQQTLQRVVKQSSQII